MSKLNTSQTLQTAVTKGLTNAPSGILQRKCACGTHTIAGDKCDECKKGARQRKSSNNSEHSEIPPIVHEVLNSPGQPLDKTTRAFFEPRFAHNFIGMPISSTSQQLSYSHLTISKPTDIYEQEADRTADSIMLKEKHEDKTPSTNEQQGAKFDLSQVRIHTDTRAAESAKAVNALAYTVGNNVVFGASQYKPGTHQGQRLLAHELTHVAQQRAYVQPTVQRVALALNYDQLARDIENAVSGLGTDEEAIYRALTKLERDPESLAELEAAYSRLFSETLMQALEGDLDDEELDYAKGLMGMAVTAGSRQTIETVTPTTDAEWDTQAQRIKAAVEYGVFGGTDEEAIFAVLQPLAGDANKIEKIKQAYARITGGPSTALVDAINDEMSGSELTHALGLLGVPDPHAGTRTELASAEVLAVRNELNPGSAVAPPPPPPSGGPAPPLPAPARWDGRVGAVNAAANRAALQSDLTTDLTNHLNRVIPSIRAQARAPKVPVTNLEGAANAAVEVTDDEYRSWYGVAATTPAQTLSRSGFQFSQAAGNLQDATDPAARAAMGIPLSASSVANWMVRHDDPPAPPGAVEHMAAHSFNPDRRPDVDGERAWLQTNVINPFISPRARNADLLLYDQFGFALQPEPGKIVLPTSLPGSSLAGGNPPNLIDRRFLWSTWHTAVHEYIHNLAHPAFEESLSENNEGFTEYFTKSVITKVAPAAHQNSSLVQKVEGGIFAPPTTPALVGPYSTPPSYAADLAHVENVRATVPGGDNTLRAAYFQGHTEMLGIDPATSDFATAPPGAVDPIMVNVPAGIASLADLATRSGVPISEILAANAGLTAVSPLPPRLRLPGVREHRVVTTFEPAGVVGQSETVEQIAAQNGVSVEALRQANPGVVWAALTRNQLILIPRH